jgi:uncharacterized protein (TIGR02246 family)
MKKLLLIALPLTLMLAVQAQSKDEKSIQKIVIDFERAFNAKEAKETARFWAEDGEFVTYQGKLLHGPQEVENYFQNTFVQFYQTAKNRLFAPTVKFLKPDVAAVDVKWEIIGRTDADGKTLPTMKGIMVWTMTKEKGRWLIKTMHNVSLPE